ncbi:MAG TPA: hypothetical protein PLW40_10340, partial [Syntrophales bacterium]|nr:hypothetical protein [Syntrophales bacterium]HOM08069.1 hypothetical protein [Syntrophales bacterium]HPQ07481.1 hypothetical protein [Syntrophales bacterium]
MPLGASSLPPSGSFSAPWSSSIYDRKLLAALSRCVWESLKVFIQQSVPEKEPTPGAVIAVQTFGDYLGFNPHCH